jgi:hypothetical protein
MFNHFIGYTQLNDTNIIHKNKPVVFDKSYYTQKAHNANKNAWVLLAGGVFIELVANLSYNKRQTEDVYTDGNLTITSADRKAIILNWQTVIGTLPILASIPFFISSMHYKAKAKKVVVP